jgi:hypothetical protein
MEKDQAEKATSTNELRRDEPKEVYVEPKLTVHGNVEEITKAVGTKGVDGLAGSSVG